MGRRLVRKVISYRSSRVRIALAVFDYLAVCAAYLMALWIRFDFSFRGIDQRHLAAYKSSIFVYALACIAIFGLFRLYNRVWRYVGMDILLDGIRANAVCIALYIPCVSIFCVRMPISYYAIGGLLQVIFTLILRISYRVYKDFECSISLPEAARVMIIGAGEAGQMLHREIVRNLEGREKVVCFIDDNPEKKDCYLEGTIIAGNRNDILASVEKYGVNKIIFAIPSASPAAKRDILSICAETECELKHIPPIYVNQKLTISSVGDIKMEDILGRAPIKVNEDSVCDFIEDKVVLVTGGGGSIGSELCRQIAAHCPRTLVIFDIYENNAYSIQLELKKKYPEADIVTLIGSVRDTGRLDNVFSKYRPDIVFHAAAHKHVPLMEESPCESIKNNVLGTYKTACAAMKYGCGRFVLISTDKAVNPTNVMGASKRLCEMIVQSFDRKIRNNSISQVRGRFIHEADLTPSGGAVRTEFVAVRFGNVLGSNGSVVPIFKRQIEEGGPVTVTHPDIIRYFMTVSEAVSLVLQAGAYAQGGEIFVLDMGSPVKIDTLARNLIRLSGLRPDVDIKIEYTGLRPGEKLYEEKLMADEGLEKTDNDLIYIGHPVDFDAEKLLDRIPELYEAAYRNDEDIRELVMDMVPTYQPAEPTAAR